MFLFPSRQSIFPRRVRESSPSRHIPVRETSRKKIRSLLAQQGQNFMLFLLRIFKSSGKVQHTHKIFFFSFFPFHSRPHNLRANVSPLKPRWKNGQPTSRISAPLHCLSAFSGAALGRWPEGEMQVGFLYVLSSRTSIYRHAFGHLATTESKISIIICWRRA